MSPPDAGETASDVRRIGKLEGVRTNFPDPGFDPVAATPEALTHHCLPPRPDPQQAPVAYAHWERAMASRPSFPENPVDANAFGEDVFVMTQRNRTVTQESSRNWSGAVVRPRSFDDMVLVQGRWTVPDTPPFTGGRGYASSVWVGLDGHDAASRVLPQIGTGQLAFEFPAGPGYPGPVRRDRQSAWWQLWLRDDPNLWQVPIPLAIRRNDQVYAQVHAFAPTIVSFYLRNETTNVAYAAHYHVREDAANPYARPLERRTAEWVVERPLTPDRLGPEAQPIALPLADYGATTFTACNAATADAAGILHEFQLQRARLMRMNVWDEPDAPGRLVSRPGPAGDDAVLMRYVDRD